MKNKRSVAIAGTLIVICLLLPLCGKHLKRNAYDIVVFGDSIMAGVYEDKTVPELLGELSGCRVLNAAFGGTTMAYLNEGAYAGNNRAFFSMYSLSEAVKYNDFSLIEMSSLASHDFTDDLWKSQVEVISKADIRKAKIVVIEHGCNDYQSGVRIENAENPFDKNTYSGALRCAVENIRKGAPDAAIVLMTPVFNHIEEYDACNIQDFGGGTLNEYVEAMKKVASEYGLTFVDNYSESGINEENYTEYLADGVHLTDKGSRLIADKLWNEIETLVNNQR